MPATMTNPATRAPDDDELPELAPLDRDEGFVEVPDEVALGAWEEAIADDDDVVGIDPRALLIAILRDDASGEDDEGSPDDPMDPIPDDDRGGWVGDDDRGGDDVAEIEEPAPDHPDGGEDGPTRDPYDEVDTALPALDDDDDPDGPAGESPSR